MSDGISGGEVSSQTNKRSARKIVGRIAGIFVIVAVMAGVFWLGLSIGNGSIQTLFSKPTSSNSGLPNNLNYAEVEQLYDTLRANFDGKLDKQKLIDGMKTGLVNAAGDAHTIYMNAKDAESFQEQLSGTFSGIGAELGKDDKGNIIIVSPIKGFPAEKAGLKAQDVIVSINGESTTGMSIDTAVSKIRGPKGTEVKLQVFQSDSGEVKDITIIRDTITIPSVEYKIMDNNVGYIQISQFWTDTPELVREAAKEFKDKGVKSVVLDLRGNPGGSLDAAVQVASVWLPKDKTVLVEKHDGKVQRTYYANGSSLLLGMPTRVLIDKGSASASEIVAGALRDNNVAKLVGEKSYGKGSVQQIIDLASGGQLKVTVARWYRPNGQNIDKKGIEPDTAVVITKEDAQAKKDPQLDAAIQQLLGNQ